jgi:sugar (pentulose or hexulose) kinase
MAELEAAIRPQDPTGLDFYPLPCPGERFPINDPALLPRVEPRPAGEARFLQALLEGIAGVEKLGYDRLALLGGPPLRSVRSVGGGARNIAWTAIRSRSLGVPLLGPRHAEAACGAARLAWRGLGVAA